MPNQVINYWCCTVRLVSFSFEVKMFHLFYLKCIPCVVYICFFLENAGELRIIILRRKGEAKRNLVQHHTNPHTLG
jgi:hypothetical protein